MKFDALVRLIEAATPSQLRDIAHAVLVWQGYDARITDGPYDGGVDIRLYGADGQALPVAVMCSVERGWENQLRSDAHRAHTRLQLSQLLFVSSHHIPEASFSTVQADLLRAGINVSRYDQQTLASIAEAQGRMAELLDLLDVRVESSRRQPRLQFTEEAAFAFAFFGSAVADLRREVREHAVEIALHQLGGRDGLEPLGDRLRGLLGGALDQSDLRTLVDRLRQAGRLEGNNGHVSLPQRTRDNLDALLRLRAVEEQQLQQELDALLAGFGIADPHRIREAIWPDLGVILLPEGEILRDQAGSRQALRRVITELSAAGFAAVELGHPQLTALLALVGRSPLARHLRGGAVARTLQALPPGGLVAALGGGTLQLVLDASVVIPLLCVLYHGPLKERRFFLAAEALYQRARELEIPLVVPAVWLEEVAAHLLAAQDYAPVAAPDLEGMAGSSNAFVAYFAGARPLEGFSSLQEFLTSFGLRPALARDEYSRVRRTLEVHLRGLLQRYGLTIIETPARSELRRDVEVDWAWAFRDEPRHQLTARHDQQVLAWLRDAECPAGAMAVTWDRCLPGLAPPGRALDPVGVLDLLGLVRTESPPALALQFVALTLAEEQTDRAAAVWDELVRLERGRLSDAALAQRAAVFKEQFLTERAGDPDLRLLRSQWERGRTQED